MAWTRVGLDSSVPLVMHEVTMRFLVVNAGISVSVYWLLLKCAFKPKWGIGIVNTMPPPTN